LPEGRYQRTTGRNFIDRMLAQGYIRRNVVQYVRMYLSESTTQTDSKIPAFGQTAASRRRPFLEGLRNIVRPRPQHAFAHSGNLPHRAALVKSHQARR
jgi:hypothetical protein